MYYVSCLTDENERVLNSRVFTTMEDARAHAEGISVSRCPLVMKSYPVKTGRTMCDLQAENMMNKGIDIDAIKFDARRLYEHVHEWCLKLNRNYTQLQTLFGMEWKTLSACLRMHSLVHSPFWSRHSGLNPDYEYLGVSMDRREHEQYLAVEKQWLKTQR